jgi:hypothetical protein
MEAHRESFEKQAQDLYLRQSSNGMMLSKDEYETRAQHLQLWSTLPSHQVKDSFPDPGVRTRYYRYDVFVNYTTRFEMNLLLG